MVCSQKRSDNALNATKLFALCFKLNHIQIKLLTFVTFVLGFSTRLNVNTWLLLLAKKTVTVIQNRQMRQYYANISMLLRNFSHCSPDMKYCMFKCHCAIWYCSSIWFDSTITTIKNIYL